MTLYDKNGNDAFTGKPIPPYTPLPESKGPVSLPPPHIVEQFFGPSYAPMKRVEPSGDVPPLPDMSLFD